MKFLHLADLHIGKTVNGFSMLEDQKFALKQILKQLNGTSATPLGVSAAAGRDGHSGASRSNASAMPFDALIIAGDLYDKSQPSAEAVALVDWFFTEVIKTGIPCLVIPGNHDGAERVSYLSGPLATNKLYVAKPFQGHLEKVTLSDEHGPVNFWLIPFMRPADVRRYFPESDIGTSYTRALQVAIDDAHIDSAERNVAVAHQFVSFGSRAPELSDSETASVGGLDEVSAQVFDAFDYVALGHIHKSQAVGAPTVRYAGSLLKYSFSEANYKKAFPVVEMGEKGEVSVGATSIQPLHDMREVTGSLEELLRAQKMVDGDEKEGADPTDYLHIILTDENPIPDALALLRQVYPNTMALDYQVALARQNSTGELSLPKVNFKPDELFEEFFEKQTGLKLTERQEALFREKLDQCLKGGDAE